MLPIFVKLANERVVVVGGGPIAARKAVELNEAGAHVVVVSPAFTETFPDVAERVERAFARGDTHGAVLVFACTGDRAVDDAVAADARESGALVNVVDRAEVSSFYSAATVKRGPVVVAVGTAGASPTLARKVRDRIDEVLPAGLGILGEILGRARPRLLAKYPDMNERARVLEAFVERSWWRFFAGPARPELGNDIERAVNTELLATDTRDTRDAAGQGA